MLQVVGIQEVSGEFEGRPYHNYKIHCYDDSQRNVIGNAVMNFNVKVERFKDIVELYKGNLKDIVGANIEIYYDQYRRVSKVDIVG